MNSSYFHGTKCTKSPDPGRTDYTERIQRRTEQARSARTKDRPAGTPLRAGPRHRDRRMSRMRRRRPSPGTRKGAFRRPPKRGKARRGDLPRGPLPAPGARAHIEKRPPRARRPALPQPGAAVLSAKAGLTAGFGMGPGDPRLCGRARGGRSPAALCMEPARNPSPGRPWRPHGGHGQKMAHRARCFPSRMRRARAISAARLSASPRLHLRPIDQVVYLGPYRKVDSSRRRLPA